MGNDVANNSERYQTLSNPTRPPGRQEQTDTQQPNPSTRMAGANGHSATRPPGRQEQTDIQQPVHRDGRSKGRTTYNSRSLNHVLLFFKFHYFLWPVLFIFACKLVTFIGCSFPLTMKQCKIKRQSAVPFLTLPDHQRQDCVESEVVSDAGATALDVTRNHCLEGPPHAQKSGSQAHLHHWDEWQ